MQTSCSILHVATGFVLLASMFSGCATPGPVARAVPADCAPFPDDTTVRVVLTGVRESADEVGGAALRDYWVFRAPDAWSQARAACFTRKGGSIRIQLLAADGVVLDEVRMSVTEATELERTIVRFQARVPGHGQQPGAIEERDFFLNAAGGVVVHCATTIYVQNPFGSWMEETHEQWLRYARSE